MQSAAPSHAREERHRSRASGLDWRDVALDAARLALLVGALLTLAFGPREQSFRLVLTFVLVLVPRALAVPRLFDLAFVLAMSFQAWGNVFGAFDGVYGYDKIVHFLLPAATSSLVYLFLVRMRAIPELASDRRLHATAGILLLTMAFGLTLGGGLYELYEWFADRFLGAHLYTSYGDTIGDLTDDMLGSLIGGVLIIVWNRAGWSSRRPDAPSPATGPRPDRSDDRLARLAERVVGRLRAIRANVAHRRPLPRLPRWLGGDWTRLVRDPVDLLRLALAGGLIAAAATGDVEDAVRFAITLLAAIAVRALRVPRLFDLAFVAAVSLQAWGAFLGLFSAVGGYGAVVHLAISAPAACVLYLALVRLRIVPDLAERHDIHQHLAIAITATCFGFAAGIAYEQYVFVADHVLGASFDVTYDQLIGRLGLDFVGALGGAAVMVVWSAFGWGTRRVPGWRLRQRPAE